jgi:enamine deaminase RidA (YjgF/YER057c/UK114 family)
VEGAVPDVRIFNPADLAPPIGFAHAGAAHGWVWLGGQISNDSTGKVLFAGDMSAQFRQALQNVVVALGAAGSRPEDVIKLTYFVTDIGAYRAALKPIGAAYRELFGRHYPPTSLFEVKGLFEPAAMIEIECVAVQSRAADIADPHNT